MEGECNSGDNRAILLPPAKLVPCMGPQLCPS